MRNVNLMLAVAGALAVASGAANAATRTTTFGVAATVNANCLVTAGALDFLGYDGTAEKTATSTISVRCSSGHPYTIALDAGGGSFAQRLLSGPGGSTLEYNLFTSGAPSAPIWGDGTSSTDTVGGTGAGMASGSAQPHTVYGVLPDSPNNQAAPAGSYSDTITVTVSY
jgi:spore coat protein U-like protein